MRSLEVQKTRDRRVRGMILDVDGTLLDSMAIWNEAGSRYLKTLGIAAEEGLGEILFPMSVPEAAEYLKSRYRIAQTTEQISAGIVRAVEKFYLYEAALKPGVKGFLEELRKRQIPAVCATTSEADYLKPAFRRLKIEGYIQAIITGSDAGVGKTEPKMYLMAAEKLSVPPGNLIVAEDVLYALRTAKKAGFLTLGIYDSASSADQKEIRREADVYLKSFQMPEALWAFIGSRNASAANE